MCNLPGFKPIYQTTGIPGKMARFINKSVFPVIDENTSAEQCLDWKY